MCVFCTAKNTLWRTTRWRCSLRDNYLKRYRRCRCVHRTTSIKLKDGDEIVQEIETSNKGGALLFSDKCNVYKYKISEIADSKGQPDGRVFAQPADDGARRKIIFYSSDSGLFRQFSV